MNHPTTSALLEAVYAAPEDDAPRAVLSDWLQEQNDPRGQFISLQLREHAGTATNAEVAQAQRLVEVHGSQWIGNLAPAVDQVRRILQRSLRQLTVSSDVVWDQLVQCTGLTSLECTEWSGNLLEDRFRDLVLPFLERTRSIQEVGCHLGMLAGFSSSLRNRRDLQFVPEGSRLEVVGNPRIAARLAVLVGKRLEVVSRPVPSGLLIIQR
jgi:uncharacterized protein (TIGR02996 family)